MSEDYSNSNELYDIYIAHKLCPDQLTNEEKSTTGDTDISEDGKIIIIVIIGIVMLLIIVGIIAIIRYYISWKKSLDTEELSK